MIYEGRSRRFLPESPIRRSNPAANSARSILGSAAEQLAQSARVGAGRSAHISRHGRLWSRYIDPTTVTAGQASSGTQNARSGAGLLNQEPLTPGPSPRGGRGEQIRMKFSRTPPQPSPQGGGGRTRVSCCAHRKGESRTIAGNGLRSMEMAFIFSPSYFLASTLTTTYFASCTFLRRPPISRSAPSPRRGGLGRGVRRNVHI